MMRYFSERAAKFVGTVGFIGILATANSTASLAQTYVATYTGAYVGVTPPGFLAAEQQYYNYLVSHGNPPWASNLRDFIAYRKSVATEPKEAYHVLIGKDGDSYVCAIESLSRHVSDVMLYNGHADETYSIHRQPGSIGNVYIDKGLNTYNLPFIPLTGISSPFIKPNAAAGTFAYPYPVKSAPPRTSPGTSTRLLYVEATLKERPAVTELTSLGPQGQKDYVWDFSTPTDNNRLPVSSGITRTDYQPKPIPPFAVKQLNFVSVPKGTLTLKLDSYHDNDVKASLFQVSTWLKPHDSITDNRHSVQKVAYYERSYGGIDEQLYRDVGHRDATKRSWVGVVVGIAGTTLIIVWMLYRRRQGAS